MSNSLLNRSTADTEAFRRRITSYNVCYTKLLREFDIDIHYGMRSLQPAGTLVLMLPPETIAPMCSPALLTGEHPLERVEDLQHHMLIHSVRCLMTWRDWMRQHRKIKLDISRGLRFDRSFMSISAAVDRNNFV